MPLLDGFMSHRAWTPFARLTYGAYLTHPIIIKCASGNAKGYYTFEGMDVYYRWIGNSVAAYGASLILWILIERPMMTLTTAALKKNTKPPTEATKAGVEKDAIKEGKEESKEDAPKIVRGPDGQPISS
jgi:peptidoglycan/LPS O-acetylase OafA/YrhL